MTLVEHYEGRSQARHGYFSVPIELLLFHHKCIWFAAEQRIMF